MMRAIRMRQNQRNAFDASLHGAKINIPSYAEEDEPIELDSSMEEAIKRMAEENLKSKRAEKLGG